MSKTVKKLKWDGEWNTYAYAAQYDGANKEISTTYANKSADNTFTGTNTFNTNKVTFEQAIKVTGGIESNWNGILFTFHTGGAGYDSNKKFVAITGGATNETVTYDLNNFADVTAINSFKNYIEIANGDGNSYLKCTSGTSTYTKYDDGSISLKGQSGSTVYTLTLPEENSTLATQDFVTGKNYITKSDISVAAATGTGNAITALSYNNGVITPTKGTTFLTSSTIPLATSTANGGIKIGYAETEGGRNYAVKLSGGKAYVNVPWNDTTYDLSGYATKSELASYETKNELDNTLAGYAKLGASSNVFKGSIKADGSTETVTYATTIDSSGVTFTSALNNTKISYNGVTRDNQSYAFPVKTGNQTFAMISDLPENATSTKDGLMSKTDYTKLAGIAEGANNYVLPTATSNALGGIKIGYSASGKNYAVQLDTNDKAYVYVPWTDNNTTYTLASGDTSNKVVLKNGSGGVVSTVTVDNVASATKATQDGSGNTITATYATLSGATFTGDVSRGISLTDGYVTTLKTDCFDVFCSTDTTMLNGTGMTYGINQIKFYTKTKGTQSTTSTYNFPSYSGTFAMRNDLDSYVTTTSLATTLDSYVKTNSRPTLSGLLVEDSDTTTHIDINDSHSARSMEIYCGGYIIYRTDEDDYDRTWWFPSSSYDELEEEKTYYAAFSYDKDSVCIDNYAKLDSAPNFKTISLYTDKTGNMGITNITQSEVTISASSSSLAAKYTTYGNGSIKYSPANTTSILTLNFPNTTGTRTIATTADIPSISATNAEIPSSSTGNTADFITATDIQINLQ